MSVGEDEAPTSSPGDALFGVPDAAVPAAGRAVAPAPPPVAGTRVAQVVVDVPLPHLDREFDYLVPDELAGAAGPDEVVVGTRVKVPFAGRERDGWVLGVRALGPDDTGRRLASLRRLVSPVVTLTPPVLALARAVADRYAGTLSDVLRFAVPSRHARAEAGVLAAVAKAAARAAEVAVEREAAEESEVSDEIEVTDVGTSEGAGADVGHPASPWDEVPGGPALLRRLREGEAPRAVWSVVGGPARWREALAEAALATRAAGRGVLVVVPDLRDVEALVPYLAERLGEEVGRLVASDGPSVRARAHLRALTGLTRVVVGTRSAAWAPLVDLGLVVCWDDGDDSLVEQRSPYPHAAQVLALRAVPERAAVLLASPSRSVWSQHLVETGWAVSLRAERSRLREVAPRVSAPDAEDLARSGPGGHARIPTPCGRRCARGSRTAPCSCRPRAPATCPTSPAAGAGPPRAARRAAAR
ncbi:hypothetical protein C8046_02420 [Serinibacter arcticus]|uniref:Primosomal protein N' 3' DNA-binding domain-containing protein n=1 Tax=Serinibacter arcticus TaxID=1655435 RepID=A0A2U1ZRW7_9MICO|nr:hypothetical protein [Serinibacter arcticus]PWD49727.1 hypothetical protein C8046_02420 [Serinibacter arcticus]